MATSSSPDATTLTTINDLPEYLKPYEQLLLNSTASLVYTPGFLQQQLGGPGGPAGLTHGGPGTSPGAGTPQAPVPPSGGGGGGGGGGGAPTPGGGGGTPVGTGQFGPYYPGYNFNPDWPWSGTGGGPSGPGGGYGGGGNGWPGTPAPPPLPIQRVLGGPGDTGSHPGTALSDIMSGMNLPFHLRKFADGGPTGGLSVDNPGVPTGGGAHLLGIGSLLRPGMISQDNSPMFGGQPGVQFDPYSAPYSAPTASAPSPGPPPTMQSYVPPGAGGGGSGAGSGAGYFMGPLAGPHIPTGTPGNGIPQAAPWARGAAGSSADYFRGPLAGPQIPSGTPGNGIPQASFAQQGSGGDAGSSAGSNSGAGAPAVNSSNPYPGSSPALVAYMQARGKDPSTPNPFSPSGPASEQQAFASLYGLQDQVDHDATLKGLTAQYGPQFGQDYSAYEKQHGGPQPLLNNANGAMPGLTYSGTLTPQQVSAANSGGTIDMLSSGGDYMMHLDPRTGQVTSTPIAKHASGGIAGLPGAKHFDDGGAAGSASSGVPQPAAWSTQPGQPLAGYGTQGSTTEGQAPAGSGAIPYSGAQTPSAQGSGNNFSGSQQPANNAVPSAQGVFNQLPLYPGQRLLDPNQGDASQGLLTLAPQSYQAYQGYQNLPNYIDPNTGLPASPVMRNASDYLGWAASLGGNVWGNLNNLQQSYDPSTTTMRSTYKPGQYSPSQFTASTIDPNRLSIGSAGQIALDPLHQYQAQAPENWSQQTASQYMDPYTRNVTDIQKRLATRDFNEQKGTRDAAAVRAGAFGGTREGVTDELANRDLQTQLAQIEAQGDQSAYLNAQQQFGADRAAQMQNQGLNLQSALQTQGLGAQTNLAAQQSNQQANLSQYNTLFGGQLQSSLANQMAQMQAQQLAEQSKQYGANYGNQSQQFADQQQLAARQANEQLRQNALNQEMGAVSGIDQTAGGMSNLMGQANQLQLQNLGMKEHVGDVYNQLNQGALNQGYQDFMNEVGYPFQLANFQSGIMRGVPSAVNPYSQQIAQYNPFAQTIGNISGIAGLLGQYGGKTP